MEVIWGTNFFDKVEKPTPITWEADEVINGHMMFVGASGTGKTHTIRKVCRSMMQSAFNPVRIHVFDVHDDIDFPADGGVSSVLFSETTQHGFNPFVVNPDPHDGGVRKCIQNFINVVNKTSRKLGSNQEAVLRNILLDLFAANGFYPDNPGSWMLNDGSYRKYPKRYPTLEDAHRFAMFKLRKLYTGADSKAGRALEDLNKEVSKLLRQAQREANQEDVSSTLERLKGSCVDAYQAYIGSIQTGLELDEAIRFGKRDELQGIVNRLETLKSVGIFKNKLPPFDDGAPIWRYRIKSLNVDERKLFVLFKLWDLFREAVSEGQKDYIDRVIVLDEGHIYMDEDEDNITNIIAKEARKFGVAMIVASQSTKHYPPDIIKNMGTKVVLGVDESDWNDVRRDFKLEQKQLEYLRPRETMLIQMKRIGVQRNRFETLRVA